MFAVDLTKSHCSTENNHIQAGDEMSASRSEIILKGRRSRSSGETAAAAAAQSAEADQVAAEEAQDGATGNHSTSLRMRKMALRRKRSLSVADIQAANAAPPPPPAFEDNGKGGGGGGNRRLSHLRAEESGYDSDATRKSSPRYGIGPIIDLIVISIISMWPNFSNLKTNLPKTPLFSPQGFLKACAQLRVGDGPRSDLVVVVDAIARRHGLNVDGLGRLGRRQLGEQQGKTHM